MKMQFQKIDGTKIDDYAKYVFDYINADQLTTEFKIFIGCDSLPKRIGNGATYVTAICIYKVGRAAHVIFAREHNVTVYGKTKRERLKSRLWGEVYRSVEAANALLEGDVFAHPKVTGFEVHLDVNPNEKFESNVIHNESIGYFRSLGFDAYAKPDSPAASFASDRACRGRERLGMSV